MKISLANHDFELHMQYRKQQGFVLNANSVSKAQVIQFTPVWLLSVPVACPDFQVYSSDKRSFEEWMVSRTIHIFAEFPPLPSVHVLVAIEHPPFEIVNGIVLYNEMRIFFRVNCPARLSTTIGPLPRPFLSIFYHTSIYVYFRQSVPCNDV